MHDLTLDTATDFLTLFTLFSTNHRVAGADRLVELSLVVHDAAADPSLVLRQCIYNSQVVTQILYRIVQRTVLSNKPFFRPKTSRLTATLTTSWAAAEATLAQSSGKPYWQTSLPVAGSCKKDLER